MTAVLVIITGIIGAIIATPLLNALGIKDWRARGLAVGVAAHGIGTARALEISRKCGAFAILGLGATGALTALILPYIVLLSLK